MRALLQAVLAIVAVVVLHPGEARAEPIWLTDGQIRALLVGPKLAGVYPTGLAWSETMNADGTTDYAEGARPMKGRWTLSDGVLCFSYAQLGIEGACFRYVLLGENCYEHFAASGSAADSKTGSRPMVTNGRLWRADQPRSCEHAGA